MGKKTASAPKKASPEKISKKSTKISKAKTKSEKPEVAEKENVPGVETKNLPTVETDTKLKEMCEKSISVEKAEEGKEKAEEGKETAEVEEEPREKVKVKRKDALLKKNKEEKSKSSEKSFLSLENPEEDNKEIKVPAYKKNRGIIYMSHIPHGFFEAQMRDFFKQFGTVTNLRLGRSKKSGKSRGFAFVEFKFREVAKVVAETMNNYLMFNKLVKCELIPQEKSNPAVFMGKVNPSKPPSLVSRRKAKKLHNSVKTEKALANRSARVQRNLKQMEKKLEAAGLEYKLEIS